MDENERKRAVEALVERNKTNPALQALRAACSKGPPIVEQPSPDLRKIISLLIRTGYDAQRHPNLASSWITWEDACTRARAALKLTEPKD